MLRFRSSSKLVYLWYLPPSFYIIAPSTNVYLVSFQVFLRLELSVALDTVAFLGLGLLGGVLLPEVSVKQRLQMQRNITYWQPPHAVAISKDWIFSTEIEQRVLDTNAGKQQS